MISAVFHSPGHLSLQKKEIPRAQAGSIVIEVKACAICGSDLRTMREGNSRITSPRVLGHEISGRVVEVGEGVDKYSINDRVSTGADIPCGACEYCEQGQPNCCDTNLAIGYQFDGGFSKYMILDHRVVKSGPLQCFSSHLDWELAALAEPLACCINGYEQALAPYKKPKKLVIFGAGPIGLMILILGKEIYGIEHATIIEPSEFRRETAKSFNPDAIIDPTYGNVVANILEKVGVNGADIVFTACPSLSAHKDAISVIAKNGVVNLFGGIGKDEKSLSVLSNYIHYKQAYITGSHGSTPDQHAEALRLIESKAVDLSRLITHRYPLSKINEAFDIAKSGMACKIVIKP